jgi:5'-3' exonuclease
LSIFNTELLIYFVSRPLQVMAADGVSAAKYSNSTSSNLKASVSNLPDETIYIIDGTSMFINAYYSNEAQRDFKDAYFSPQLSKQVHRRLQRYLTSKDSALTIEESNGRLPSGALAAMASQFARFIRDVKPRYLVAAFDAGRKTFRNDLYPLYKKNRPAVSSV